MHPQQCTLQLCLQTMEVIYGIDYGAKLAGTTVVAYVEQGVVRFSASAKKRDADRFLVDFFANQPHGKIFIDAPLSLPKVYRAGTENLPATQEPAGNGEVPDFHYRACDRALGAMSPMFLGGLTARAMKLAFILRGQGHEVRETYPGALARHLALPASGYKGDKASVAPCLHLLSECVGIDIAHIEIPDWHHFDALLALCSGYRHARGEAVAVGDKEGEVVY